MSYRVRSAFSEELVVTKTWNLGDQRPIKSQICLIFFLLLLVLVPDFYLNRACLSPHQYFQAEWHTWTQLKSVLLMCQDLRLQLILVNHCQQLVNRLLYPDMSIIKPFHQAVVYLIAQLLIG